VILSFFTTVVNVHGQILTDWQTRTENFQTRVKNIEFFINRFNNQPEGTSDLKTNNLDSLQWRAFREERQHQVFYLFDLQRLNRKDTVLRDKVTRFIAQVNSDTTPVFIHFADSSWFAQVDLAVTEKGKPDVLTCYLQVNKTKSGVYTWAVRSFLHQATKISERADSLLAFAPSVHGTDFMDVRLKLQNKEWIKSTNKGVGLEGVLAKIYSGAITIEGIDKISYHFLQIENWHVSVEYVNRETKNSGWLMKEIREINTDERKVLLKERHLH
jgi:hypothetical protein